MLDEMIQNSNIISYKKIISTINLKLDRPYQLQHPTIIARNSILVQFSPKVWKNSILKRSSFYERKSNNITITTVIKSSLFKNLSGSFIV